LGGALAGLAGVGGGLVYVPLFYALMPQPAGTGALSAPVMASLGAVAVTGLMSARAHARLGHVRADIARLLLPGLAAGAALGLWSALHVPGTVLLLGLALLDAAVASDYGRAVHNRNTPGPVATALAAAPIGLVSGLLGIGGGTMLTPLLRRFLPLREAVGTSALCGTLMAMTAVAINLALEDGWRALLGPLAPWLAGAWLGVGLAMPRAVNASARLHARLNEGTVRLMLRLLFASLAAAFFATALWRLAAT